jgi:MazG family protein
MVLEIAIINTESDPTNPIGLVSFVLGLMARKPRQSVVVVHKPCLEGGADPDSSRALVLSSDHLTLPGAGLLGFGVEGSVPSLDLGQWMERVLVAMKGFALVEPSAVAQAAIHLARIIAQLRAPGGCPWDREQTFESLRRFMIEEAYEATDAALALAKAKAEGLAENTLITQGAARAAVTWAAAAAVARNAAAAAFADELGDVLLQVVLNAQLASEEGLFDLGTVIQGLSQKMIRRHPHVFAPTTTGAAASADDVRHLWEGIKNDERQQQAALQPNEQATTTTPRHTGLLYKAAKKTSLPTLEFAVEVSRRASKLGFCWGQLGDIWADVESEISELKSEIFSSTGTPPNIDCVRDELGDVVYALANLVTHLGSSQELSMDISFDDAARQGVTKFLNRFQEMELIYSEENGEPLSETAAKAMDLDQWNELWRRAKLRRYR